VKSDIAMTALRNQPTTTTPECRHATLGARRTRAIVPDGFGAAQAVPDLTEVDRPGLGYDQGAQALRLARAGTGTDAPRTPVPHPQPAGWVDTSGRDATAQQFRVTPKTPVLPRWPTYRSLRLDQPGR
jgi:hypothetical protein